MCLCVCAYVKRTKYIVNDLTSLPTYLRDSSFYVFALGHDNLGLSISVALSIDAKCFDYSFHRRQVQTPARPTRSLSSSLTRVVRRGQCILNCPFLSFYILS